MNNNLVKNVDPSGHIPREEICKYWGVCDEDAFKKRFGEAAFTLLWDTDVSWGSTIVWNDKNGNQHTAYLMVLNFEGYYTGGLVEVIGSGENRKGNVYGLDVLASSKGAIGSLNNNDPNVVKNLPSDLDISSDFCEPQYCFEEGDYRWDTEAQIDTDIHPGWVLATGLGVTGIGGFVASGLSNAIGYFEIASEVRKYTGLDVDLIKRLEYVYDHTVGTMGDRIPTINIVFREFRPGMGKEPYEK